MDTIKQIMAENEKGIYSMFNACMHKAECCSKADEIVDLKRQLEEALKDAVEAGKKCDGLVVALERTLRWVDEMCQTGPEFGFEEIEKQANAAIEQAKGGV